MFCYMLRVGKNGQWQVIRKHKAMVFMVGMLVLWILSCIYVMIFVGHVTLPVRDAPRTVVSISSFSQRVFHMRECLDSVFAQSKTPDRVIISIPTTFRKAEKTACWFYDENCVHNTVRHNESVDDMLAWFSEYTGSPYVSRDAQNSSRLYEIGVLTVQFLDHDWGPATKLIGALKLETRPDTIIITLDDDVVYHRDTVSYLSTHIQDNMTLSFGCEIWSVSGIEFIPFGGMANIFDYSITPRYCSGWLLGWVGLAYRVSYFEQDIWTFLQTLPIGCFYNDDIWLSGYVTRRGIQKVYVPNELHHNKHTRDRTNSLSTIVDSHLKYKHACARHLFPP